MRTVALLCFVLCLSQTSFAHQYFFGFAEMNYNQDEQVYEGTLILSTHDAEEWLISNDVPLIALEKHTEDYDLYPFLELELFSGFAVDVNKEKLNFELVGYEVLKNGQTQFYFHSQKIEEGKELDIKFDLMMSEYPKQQNKLNYTNENKILTAVFIANHTQSSISLK